MAGLTDRDHYIQDPLDRIQALEEQVAQLERTVATMLQMVNAGTAGATEAGWIQISGEATGYLRVYGSK